MFKISGDGTNNEPVIANMDLGNPLSVPNFKFLVRGFNPWLPWTEKWSGGPPDTFAHMLAPLCCGHYQRRCTHFLHIGSCTLEVGGGGAQIDQQGTLAARTAVSV